MPGGQCSPNPSPQIKKWEPDGICESLENTVWRKRTVFGSRTLLFYYFSSSFSPSPYVSSSSFFFFCYFWVSVKICSERHIVARYGNSLMLGCIMFNCSLGDGRLLDFFFLGMCLCLCTYVCVYRYQYRNICNFLRQELFHERDAYRS